MAEIVFEYKPLPSSKGKIYPLAKIDLLYENKKQTFWPIIDSGANVSIFPKAVGDVLGIDFEHWISFEFRASSSTVWHPAAKGALLFN